MYNGLMYSDDQILNIVMEQIQNDRKYDTTVNVITMEISIQDTFKHKIGSQHIIELDKTIYDIISHAVLRRCNMNC